MEPTGAGDMTTWMSLLDKYGWPAGGLFLLLFVIWRAWVFCKPYVVKFMEAQLGLIATVERSSERSAEATEKMSDSMKTLHDRHDRHDRSLQAIVEAISKKG